MSEKFFWYTLNETTDQKVWQHNFLQLGPYRGGRDFGTHMVTGSRNSSTSGISLN
jgi:hypothetical protein